MELEEIGLKWSVISTAPWDTMFEALSDYKKMKIALDPKVGWDGDVPANYKTKDGFPKVST